jgi:solute carrier family 12 sodium/potassium/chloride transporter 2
VTAVADEADRPAATRFLAEVVDLTRLPAATTTKVLLGDFHAAARAAPPTDLSILGLQADPDFAFLRQALTSTGATCLFVADSGSEDARV